MVNASASQARGPRFEFRWEHSSFSLNLVPVAPRVALSGMGQARINTSTLYRDDSALVLTNAERFCEGYFVSHMIRSVYMILTMLLDSQGERGWCQGPIPEED